MLVRKQGIGLADTVYDAIAAWAQTMVQGKPLTEVAQRYLQYSAYQRLPRGVRAILKAVFVSHVLGTAAADLSAPGAAGKADYCFPSNDALRVVKECLGLSLLHQQVILRRLWNASS